MNVEAAVFTSLSITVNDDLTPSPTRSCLCICLTVVLEAVTGLIY